MSDKEYRSVEVLVGIDPAVNEQVMAENIRNVLADSELFDSRTVEFGSIIVYERTAQTDVPKAHFEEQE